MKYNDLFFTQKGTCLLKYVRLLKRQDESYDMFFSVKQYLDIAPNKNSTFSANKIIFIKSIA